jgi:uncharacterized membrane protein YeaQ/YmgE (transglycosylase-associated protein family)
MGILSTVLVGVIAGALAKLIMPGRDPGGFLVTMLLGIAGAFAASLIGKAAGWFQSPDQGPGIVASAIGAVVLLALYRLIAGRRTKPRPQ